jgi:hypothetical protein
MRISPDHVELSGVGHLVSLSTSTFVMGNEKDVADWDGDARPNMNEMGQSDS